MLLTEYQYDVFMYSGLCLTSLHGFSHPDTCQSQSVLFLLCLHVHSSGLYFPFPGLILHTQAENPSSGFLLSWPLVHSAYRFIFLKCNTDHICALKPSVAPRCLQIRAFKIFHYWQQSFCFSSRFHLLEKKKKSLLFCVSQKYPKTPTLGIFSICFKVPSNKHQISPFSYMFPDLSPKDVIVPSL